MKKYVSILAMVVLLGGCALADDLAENKDKTTTQTEPPKDQKAGSEPVDAQEEQSANQADQNREEKPEKDSVDPDLTLEAAYFNEIVEANGKKEIANPDNILVLVNKEFSLPAGYAPGDLVRPKVAFSFGEQDIEKSYLRKEAAEALEQMFQAAAKEGIQLYASSGYRSYGRQQAIFQNEIEQVGEEKAAQVVATPGSSEHQTGLTMDITSESAQFALSEKFGEMKEGEWLRNNAHLYGFILRYPKGKENITGYSYEPWHFRYVGKKAAKVIFERNWTLEEYFENVAKI